MKYLEESEIGLLINSETNKHSTHLHLHLSILNTYMQN